MKEKSAENEIYQMEQQKCSTIKIIKIFIIEKHQTTLDCIFKHNKNDLTKFSFKKRYLTQKNFKNVKNKRNLQTRQI